MGDEHPLVTEYRKTLPDKLKLLREHIEAVKRDKSLESLDTLRRDAHKIAGSSGTYGFMTASDLCKNLDLDLQEKMKSYSQAIFTPEWLKSLDLFLQKMEKAFDNPDKRIDF